MALTPTKSKNLPKSIPVRVLPEGAKKTALGWREGKSFSPMFGRSMGDFRTYADSWTPPPPAKVERCAKGAGK
jgi:hypothetical protein